MKQEGIYCNYFKGILKIFKYLNIIYSMAKAAAKRAGSEQTPYPQLSYGSLSKIK